MLPSGDRDSRDPAVLRVLHVSGDFPDPIEPFKTRAIESLIRLTRDRFEHSVVSINRTQPGIKKVLGSLLRPAALRVETEPFEYGTALRYFAPGRGIQHKTKLRQLGDWLVDHISRMPNKPDLIMGHKLAIEGIAVRRAALACGLPYGLSIQGDSDTKIMDARPDLRPELSRVLHESSIIFPFAPWAWKRITDRLGTPNAPAIVLPCATDIDAPLAPQSHGSGLICAFHLMNYRRKNLSTLTRAMKLLSGKGQSPNLTILGGGSSSDRSACEKMILGVPQIELAGEMGREEVRMAMNQAKAFVLPSLRESFGLVFIEALFAGAPIIYPRGTAVDGYFDGAPFAIAVDARSPQSIAQAIEYAVNHEEGLKAELKRWQASSEAKMFQRSAIADSFTEGLSLACR